MGWASGSELVRRVATRVSAVVSNPLLKRSIFDELIAAAIDGDCDTLDECRGIDPELDASIDEQWGSEDEYLGSED